MSNIYGLDTVFRVPAIQPLDMNGFKIINLANGSNPTDAVNVSQLGISTSQPLNVIATSFPNTGNIPMNNFHLTGMSSGGSTSTNSATIGDVNTIVNAYIPNEIATTSPFGTYIVECLGSSGGLGVQGVVYVGQNSNLISWIDQGTNWELLQSIPLYIVTNGTKIINSGQTVWDSNSSGNITLNPTSSISIYNNAQNSGNALVIQSNLTNPTWQEIVSKIIQINGTQFLLLTSDSITPSSPAIQIGLNSQTYEQFLTSYDSNNLLITDLVEHGTDIDQTVITPVDQQYITKKYLDSQISGLSTYQIKTVSTALYSVSCYGAYNSSNLSTTGIVILGEQGIGTLNINQQSNKFQIITDQSIEITNNASTPSLLNLSNNTAELTAGTYSQKIDNTNGIISKIAGIDFLTVSGDTSQNVTMSSNGLTFNVQNSQNTVFNYSKTGDPSTYDVGIFSINQKLDTSISNQNFVSAFTCGLKDNTGNHEQSLFLGTAYLANQPLTGITYASVIQCISSTPVDALIITTGQGLVNSGLYMYRDGLVGTYPLQNQWTSKVGYQSAQTLVGIQPNEFITYDLCTQLLLKGLDQSQVDTVEDNSTTHNYAIQCQSSGIYLYGSGTTQLGKITSSSYTISNSVLGSTNPLIITNFDSTSPVIQSNNDLYIQSQNGNVYIDTQSGQTTLNFGSSNTLQLQNILSTQQIVGSGNISIQAQGSSANNISISSGQIQLSVSSNNITITNPSASIIKQSYPSDLQIAVDANSHYLTVQSQFYAGAKPVSIIQGVGLSGTNNGNGDLLLASSYISGGVVNQSTALYLYAGSNPTPELDSLTGLNALFRNGTTDSTRPKVGSSFDQTLASTIEPFEFIQRKWADSQYLGGSGGTKIAIYNNVFTPTGSTPQSITPTSLLALYSNDTVGGGISLNSSGQWVLPSGSTYLIQLTNVFAGDNYFYLADQVSITNNLATAYNGSNQPAPYTSASGITALNTATNNTTNQLYVVAQQSQSTFVKLIWASGGGGTCRVQMLFTRLV